MKRLLFFSIALAVVSTVFLVSCINETTSPVQPATEVISLMPKGTIHGIIVDRCTDVPVEGALMTLSHNGQIFTAKSDVSGQFSFKDVPAGRYQVTAGGTVLSGTYTITADLTAINSAESDPTKRFRDYYYQSVTVVFTSLTPGDSIGATQLVASVMFPVSQRNYAVKGTVVDKDYQPVAGATVHLWDASIFPNRVMANATSGADGSFSFAEVDNGLTIDISARSADGKMTGNLAGTYTLPCNHVTDSLRAQVTTERIQLTQSDDTAPQVIAISPENNADVTPTNLSVVFTFSEPIKQTAYTRTDLGLGHGTIMDDITFTYVGLKKALGPAGFAAAWNASFTQLTITPDNVTGSARYQVSAGTAIGKLKDNADRLAVNNTNITGDFENLNFTTNGGSTVPAKPTLARRYITGVYSSLDYTGGAVGMVWNLDQNARSYNIYKKIGRGSFERVATNIPGPTYAETVGLLVSPAPSATVSPTRAEQVQYIVRGVSFDLAEGLASDPIIVGDDVKPRLVNATVIAQPGGPANTWWYTLDFGEPMNFSTCDAESNYSFANTGAVSFTLNEAIVLGWNNGTGRYQVRLVVTTSGAPIPGYILTVSTNATDVSGNGMDTQSNGNTRTF